MTYKTLMDPKNRDSRHDWMLDEGVAERLAKSGVLLTDMSQIDSTFQDDTPVLIITKGPAAGLALAITQDPEWNGPGFIQQVVEPCPKG